MANKWNTAAPDPVVEPQSPGKRTVTLYRDDGEAEVMPEDVPAFEKNGYAKVKPPKKKGS